MIASCRRGVGLVASLMLLAAAGRAQSTAPRAPVPGAPAGVTAFVDVGIVPMDTERVLRHQTVLVRDGRIAAMGPTKSVAVPDGAVRIKGRGRYLVPGFGSCHGHGSYLSDVMSPGEPGYVELVLLQQLAAGVTVVRNVDYVDRDARIAGFGLNGTDWLRLRARSAEGEIWSPRIYTTGQWAPKQYIGAQRRWHPDSAAFWPAPRLDSIAAYVAAFKAAGYDFLKFHEEYPEVAESVMVAAKRVGLPVEGHVVTSLERAIAGGQQLADHAGGFLGGGPEIETVPEVNGKPDSATWRRLAAANAGRLARAGMWSCDATYAFTRALVDSGAPLLSGGDGGWSAIQLSGAVKKAGLTPYQALAITTRNYGRYLRTLDPRGGEAGTIAIGQRADLVMLRGNPLADIRHALPPPEIVMVGGRWLTRQELARRVAAATQYTGSRAFWVMVWGSIRSDSTVTAEQRQAVARLDSVYRPQQFALAERFGLSLTAPAGGADSLQGAQRMAELYAEQLGKVRALLPAQAQAAFDEYARRWVNDQAKDGFRVTIPGLRTRGT